MNQKQLDAFCSDLSPEIFHPVAYTNDVWRPDPFDVREVHQDARELFEELVERTMSQDQSSGRILLVKGESGAGKTHLMRAFRNHVHGLDLAFFGYMQMTTSAARYDRYVLQKLVESLDQPYLLPGERLSSLRKLSDKLAHLLPKDRVQLLRETNSTEDAGRIVDELSDRLVDRLHLPDVNVDLLRALLYLQSERPSIKIRVIKYIRMEPLSEHDSKILGGMPARHPDDDPMVVIQQLANVTRSVLNRGLVVCVDQLEDMFNLEGTQDRFARAMDVVRQVAEIPGTVVVVSCLEMFYDRLRSKLTESVLARLEQDPAPVVLKAQRNPEEARHIASRRLNHLYDVAKAPTNDAQSVEPISGAVFASFRRGTARMILEDCLRYREAAQNGRQLPKSWPPRGADLEPAVTTPNGPLTQLIQEWNEFVSDPQPVPEDERALAGVLQRAISSCAAELGVPDAFVATVLDDDPWVRVRHGDTVQGANGDLLIAVCESNPQGGGLLRQIKGARANAGKKATPAIVRSTPFPSSPTAQTTQELGNMVAKGGRKAVVEDSEWRRMVALDGFRRRHTGQLFLDFLVAEMPISTLASIREILDLDNIVVPRAVGRASQDLRPSDLPHNRTSPNTNVDKTSPAAKNSQSSTRAPSGSGHATASGRIVIGETIGRKPHEVVIEPEDLKRHMAFMGGTGSGKTTAALHVVESLLARGVPAILIDRKGDLCGYRRADVWGATLGDAERDGFREVLRSKLEVAVYTPGKANGRGLALPLLPRGTRDLSGDDREHVARISAGALGDMMSYGNAQKAQGKRAALQIALKQLASEGDDASLQSLVDYVKERDDGFIGELGALSKFVDDLAIDLEILAKQKRTLFGEGAEPLDAASLLGLDGKASGKTRLSIVSTKLLGSPSDELFWVAQLLLELYRWASKHPSDKLQVVVLLDEADKYLPANGQPATKQPVEDLLRRARSMGVGVFLASQNPGDFDYRCRDNIRTWLVGLLAQKRGIEKLEELFGANGDASMLSSQTTGQFHLLAEGQVTRVQMRRNAVKLPSQVSDDEVLRLAAAGTAAATTL